MRRFLVRIISRKKIREAFAEHGEWEASLAAWYRIAKAARWKHFGDVKQSWRRADSVGTCVVFDISYNRCRLIAYINYRTQKLFILHILDHVEYDRDRWKDDCDDD
jgi:mRNA interferase HigB